MARLTGPVMGTPGDSTRRTTTQELPIGTVAFGEAGKEFEYVRAGAAIAQYAAVKLDVSDGGATVIETAAVTDHLLGIADAAFAEDEYGFVQTRGRCTAKVEDATTAGLPLQPSAAGGILEATAETTPAGGSNAVALATGNDAGSAIYLR
jgi:hypothetical protein